MQSTVVLEVSRALKMQSTVDFEVFDTWCCGLRGFEGFKDA